MKLIKFVLLSLISVTAFAGQFPQTVLEVSTAGGMPMPGGNPVRGVRVLDNGIVLTFVGNQLTEIGKVTLEESQLINAAAARISGQLYDANANQPQCTDAPITSYRVMKPTGELFTFAKEMNCHHYQLQGENGYNSTLFLSFLNGLSSLSYLAVAK